jgi:hypothetical protein
MNCLGLDGTHSLGVWISKGNEGDQASDLAGCCAVRVVPCDPTNPMPR